MIALVYAIGFFHLTQKCIHLFNTEITVCTDGSVAGHGCENFIALFLNQRRAPEAPDIGQKFTNKCFSSLFNITRQHGRNSS